jgi:hypothetical protein
VQHLALCSLPGQLLVRRLERAAGPRYHLPLRRGWQRYTQAPLQLLDAIEGKPRAVAQGFLTVPRLARVSYQLILALSPST